MVTIAENQPRDLNVAGISNLLICGAVLLFVAQVILGTSVTFAAEVLLAIVAVILTLRIIGWGSIAGILIAYFCFRYVIFSQVIKTLYGQAGDSRLGAPETTIGVIFVGICTMCFAALIVSHLFRGKTFVRIDPSVDVLKHVRNISIVIGAIAILIGRYSNGGDSAEVDYGGIGQIAHQLGSLVYVSILAETWRVLKMTEGRRSTTPLLYCLIGGLTMLGIIADTKEGTAAPLLIYIIGSASYRYRITRSQLIVIGSALFGGVLFVYPAIQLLRTQANSLVQVPVSVTIGFIYDSILNPTDFFRAWSQTRDLPRTDLYAEALNYLGDFDDLEGRFMLIANTDVIVAAVNDSGPVGMELATTGLGQLVPTFINPDKSRVFTGDYVTWYYGLRSWDVRGAPTIGLLADTYATEEWAGVIVLTFIFMFAFFFELGISGMTLRQNFMGAFLLYLYFHQFSEGNIAGFESDILRYLPIYFLMVFILVRFAETLSNREARLREERLALTPLRKT